MNKSRSPSETVYYAVQFLFWVGLAYGARRVFESTFPQTIEIGTLSIQSIWGVFPIILVALVAGYVVSDRWLRRWLIRRGWLKSR